MNIVYLLQILGTRKLSSLIENIDLSLFDINLALFDAEEAGEISIDRNKDKIKALKEPVPSCDKVLEDKIYRVIQHYARKEVNITMGKLLSWLKNPMAEYNYPYHECLMAIQHLVDTGKVIEIEASVPKLKDRPFHRFVFLCLPDNDNEEWNAREINKFIDNWKATKVE